MNLQTFITVIIEGLKGYKDLFQDKTKAEEYSKLIADLTDKLSQIAKENDELRAKLKEYEDWEKTASRYELFQFESGHFAYKLKSSESETSHYICAKCFNERKRYILHSPLTSRGRHYRCPACGDSFLDDSEKGPPPTPKNHGNHSWMGA